jgi:ABC-type branched-subunit amino acid transport system substrate-binding protein
VPVVGYAADAAALSDKEQYPLFSRACPTQSVSAQGLVAALQALGWRRCALSYAADASSGELAADVASAAAAAGMTVMAMHRLDPAADGGLRRAMAALAGSGARIFVYLDATGSAELLAAALAAAREAGLAGVDGLAWVGFELPGPEAVVRSAAAPQAVRQLLYGWINVLRAAPPQVRTDRASPRAVRNLVVVLAGWRR